MTKTFCDRCEKEIDTTKNIFIQTKEGEKGSGMAFYGIQVRTKELCEDCFDSLNNDFLLPFSKRPQALPS